MIITNARILTFDADHRVLDSGSVEIRPDGSIGEVKSVARAGKDIIDAKGKLLIAGADQLPHAPVQARWPGDFAPWPRAEELSRDLAEAVSGAWIAH